jgi:hypothetical protein
LTSTTWVFWTTKMMTRTINMAKRVFLNMVFAPKIGEDF